MWVLHSWSPWLTHSNTFLKWHSYFNTIIFIYSFKISLIISLKKKKKNNWGEDKLLELYKLIFHSLRGKKKIKEYIFYMESQQKKQRLQLWTLYNLQFSNNHHNIAVNVTLNLSLKEKYTVSPRQFYSTATRKKCQRTQKRPKPFIHTLTVLCFDLHSFDTGMSYT